MGFVYISLTKEQRLPSMLGIRLKNKKNKEFG